MSDFVSWTSKVSLMHISQSLLLKRNLALFVIMLASAQFSAQTRDLLDFYQRIGKGEVMVAAHRGDWRNFPENSLEAITSCIEMGVDIVEVDVRRTADGHFVLMHDETVNRTTNGKGRVDALSLKQIRTFKLKDRFGNVTAFSVPTLEEVAQLTADRIVVNLDKSAECFDALMQKLDSMDACYQFILKANRSSEYFDARLTHTEHFPCLMPILNKKQEQVFDAYLSQAHPRVAELIASSDTTDFSSPEGLAIFRQHQCGVWYNSLFPAVSMGWDENKSKEKAWEWFLLHDAAVIQTDYPKELMAFLVTLGKR